MDHEPFYATDLVPPLVRPLVDRWIDDDERQMDHAHFAQAAQNLPASPVASGIASIVSGATTAAPFVWHDEISLGFAAVGSLSSIICMVVTVLRYRDERRARLIFTPADE